MQPRPFESLGRRLAERGVGPGRVRRIIGELEDHLESAVAALIAAGATPESARREARVRLGADDLLLTRFMGTPRVVSLARRRPELVFGATPALVFVVLSIGWISLLMVIARAARDMLAVDLEHPAMHTLFAWLDRPVDVLLPGALAWWFCRLARRRGCRAVWSVATCVALASLAATMFTNIVLPSSGERGLLLVGVDLVSVITTPQWLPLLVPLAVLAVDCILRGRGVERARFA